MNLIKTPNTALLRLHSNLPTIWYRVCASGTQDFLNVPASLWPGLLLVTLLTWLPVCPLICPSGPGPGLPFPYPDHFQLLPSSWTLQLLKLTFGRSLRALVWFLILSMGTFCSVHCWSFLNYSETCGIKDNVSNWELNKRNWVARIPR